MTKLVDDMNGGNISCTLHLGCEPGLYAGQQQNSKDGLGKVISVSFNGTMDETTELCRYVIPSHRWLSWGDAEQIGLL